MVFRRSLDEVYILSLAKREVQPVKFVHNSDLSCVEVEIENSTLWLRLESDRTVCVHSTDLLDWAINGSELARSFN